ncbi:Uncharacterized protein conserved in bacteria (plasmid) [Legionella adelaidensis]|uniref:Uncharacterized protein conserved in bacteria n=1 Tax=Legionella adelaidensis TaxID=45056 RepID=A0A0W0R5S7_9GAMM|nr:DUF305 domain-containing protein [Legionella adelaidensis]KTC66395.1 hypothetical protein Lade_1053 [Legionella adelaidensis]VEH84993.1 Uncharacterized protein conserved in bacteria [Legionella adelaidensis]
MNKSGVSYLKLSIMTLLSFIAMYILMYMMVDRFTNVYNNLNQFYMAGMMAAPMALIELFLMNSMYPNKILNGILVLLMVLILIVFIFCIRNQTGISDKEFLKSMIPHHASALLMCGEAPIEDQEIKKLCESIISSQQSEINWMKNKLISLENNR